MTLITSELLGMSRLSSVLLGMNRLCSVLLGVRRLFLMVNRLLYFTLVLIMSNFLRFSVLLSVNRLLSSSMLLRMSRLLDMGLLGRSLFNRALILNQSKIVSVICLIVNIRQLTSKQITSPGLILSQSKFILIFLVHSDRWSLVILCLLAIDWQLSPLTTIRMVLRVHI